MSEKKNSQLNYNAPKKDYIDEVIFQLYLSLFCIAFLRIYHLVDVHVLWTKRSFPGVMRTSRLNVHPFHERADGPQKWEK